MVATASDTVLTDFSRGGWEETSLIGIANIIVCITQPASALPRSSISFASQGCIPSLSSRN